jgi:hypothetical protein
MSFTGLNSFSCLLLFDFQTIATVALASAKSAERTILPQFWFHVHLPLTGRPARTRHDHAAQ